jgi:hypothetical protein
MKEIHSSEKPDGDGFGKLEELNIIFANIESCSTEQIIWLHPWASYFFLPYFETLSCLRAQSLSRKAYMPVYFTGQRHRPYSLVFTTAAWGKFSFFFFLQQ